LPARWPRAVTNPSAKVNRLFFALHPTQHLSYATIQSHFFRIARYLGPPGALVAKIVTTADGGPGAKGSTSPSTFNNERGDPNRQCTSRPTHTKHANLPRTRTPPLLHPLPQHASH
ncbi:unnamed protein product, partial [Ectocarpus sp. 12 AP-2014]